MTRRVFSILCYIVAGFFAYATILLTFMDLSSLPSSGPKPAWLKLILLTIFAVPTAVTLLCGLALSHFQHWKRDVGIVCVSATGVAAFVVLTMLCVYLSPEVMEVLPPRSINIFTAYIPGAICSITLAALGLALITMSAKKESAQVDPANVFIDA